VNKIALIVIALVVLVALAVSTSFMLLADSEVDVKPAPAPTVSGESGTPRPSDDATLDATDEGSDELSRPLQAQPSKEGAYVLGTHDGPGEGSVFDITQDTENNLGELFGETGWDPNGGPIRGPDGNGTSKGTETKMGTHDDPSAGLRPGGGGDPMED